jgi:hypothetical protein
VSSSKMMQTEILKKDYISAHILYIHYICVCVRACVYARLKLFIYLFLYLLVCLFILIAQLEANCIAPDVSGIP